MPNIVYSNDQRCSVLNLRLADNHISYRRIRDYFMLEYPGTAPSIDTIRRILADFSTTANAFKNKENRPPLQYTTAQLSEDIKINVCALIQLTAQENTNYTLNKIANDVGISKSSVRKILKEQRYHAYKKQEHQALIRNEPDRRITYCELMTEELRNNPDLLNNIVFSDECKIFLCHGPNKQHVRFWRTNAPEDVMETHTQYQQKVNVWAGMYKSHVIGPFFFEGNITGQSYLQMLTDNVLPAIRML